MATLDAGDHLLMSDAVYGPTRAFCQGTLRRFGIETSYISASIGPDDLSKMVRPNTKALFIEAPGSGSFEMTDVPSISAEARSRGLVVLMDNTWATPLFFKPLAHGVDVSIQAATKYIVGHADVLMGTITSNERLAPRILEFHGRFGLSVSGDDAYLAQRGLRTLAVRLAQHQKTGLHLAKWLAQRSEVERVLHPALETDPGHEIWRRDFSGSSGLFAIELKPIPKHAVAAFMDGLKLFGMGWSWGGFESLIVTVSLARTQSGYRPAGPLLRIHAGLEDQDDLVEDLEAGFRRIAQFDVA
jgi:cystathionine beta-lyase